LLLLVSVQDASATTYELDLTVDSVINQVLPCSSNLVPTFGCKLVDGTAVPVAMGDVFAGQFATGADISQLADGIHTIPISSFSLAIGELDWESGLPASQCESIASVPVNCLEGFRAFESTSPPPLYVFSPDPSVIVNKGAITSLYTELFSPGDLPNVDFDYRAGPGQWDAVGAADVTGTYTVHVVPEPPLAGLFAFSLGILTFIRLPPTWIPAFGRKLKKQEQADLESTAGGADWSGAR